jgi:hypothetical protein
MANKNIIINYIAVLFNIAGKVDHGEPLCKGSARFLCKIA